MTNNWSLLCSRFSVILLYVFFVLLNKTVVFPIHFHQAKLFSISVAIVTLRCMRSHAISAGFPVPFFYCVSSVKPLTLALSLAPMTKIFCFV